MPLIQPGDPPLNPTGNKGALELRRGYKAIAVAMLEFGNQPCDVPGFTHMTWFAAGMLATFRGWVAGDMDAGKEILNRCFGRVPLEAQLSVSHTSAPGASPAELYARLDALRDEARQLRDRQAIDVPLLKPDASITDVTPTAVPGNADSPESGVLRDEDRRSAAQGSPPDALGTVPTDSSPTSSSRKEE